MRKLISFGWIYITFAISFILIFKDIIQSNKDKKIKVILLSLLNFINYFLLLYCCNFVSWVVKLNKVYNYPYRYPFCIFVLFGCVIVFVISGICCIKYQKDIYSVQEAVLFLFISHIVAILILIFLRVPSFFVWL